MAFPGIGFRTVNDLAIEISLHLVQHYCSTTTLQPVATAGSATINIGTTKGMYVGASVIVDTGLSAEVVVITGLNATAAPPTFTATFALPHANGVAVTGATFPIQSATDPIFTQTEIQSYLGRAQNEFLSAVPIIFQLNTQTVQFGQVLQQLACDAIEMHRVAYSQTGINMATLARSGNIVTATSANPHGLAVNNRFAMIGSGDPSFDGVFSVATVLSPTQWTYTQVLPNASTTGGVAGLWTRLYETSQEELAMQDPRFRASLVTKLRSWFEDRTGLYQFGVSGKPASNFPIEVLVSVRDTDTLQLTDGFLVPDPLLHYVKYKAMEYIFSKDGVQADPQRARYCSMRYNRGVLATRRWLLGMEVVEDEAAMAGVEQ